MFAVYFPSSGVLGNVNKFMVWIDNTQTKFFES